MGIRFFDNYSELAFNNLYSFLKEFSERKDITAWESDTCCKLIDKIDTYFSLTEKDEIKYINLGWFGEELRDLLSLILFNYKLSENYENYFESFVAKKKEQQSAPNYYRKIQLKHLKDSVMFLINEDEILKGKTRRLLEIVGEKKDNLSFFYSDIPSRFWSCGIKLKTKCTLYNVKEIKEGYCLEKLFYDMKKDEKVKCVYKINNENFDYLKEDSKMNEKDFEMIRDYSESQN